MISKALIIPAAGAGNRMQKETPKPYLKLDGKTILERTISRFLPLEGLRQIVVVTSEACVGIADHILDEVVPETILTKSLVGGKERQDSIYNALEPLTDVDLVIVHDAVRPFVKLRHIEACCQAAYEVGGAVLGVPAKDTIKHVDEQMMIQKTPSRKYVWQAQTPQVFKKALIVRAYGKSREDGFRGTDDASLVERLGEKIKMVEGDQSNFKITYPLDLDLAQLLIDKNGNE